MTISAFKKESDMTPYVLTLAGRLFKKSTHYYAFAECVATPGIADIIFVTFNYKNIANRLQAGLGPITQISYTKVLAVLNKSKPRSFDYLVRTTGYSKSYLKKTINSLIEKGYIFSVNSNYLLNSVFNEVTNDIIAIEMKRETWIKGLYQARRYLRFANRVFLALDDTFSHRILPYTEEIINQSIGLLLVNLHENQVKIVCSPQKRKPKSLSDRLLVSERLWLALQKNSNHDDSQHIRKEDHSIELNDVGYFPLVASKSLEGLRENPLLLEQGDAQLHVYSDC